MIETRQLRYFLKVAELEHFGRASEELNIVQPALTRQIKQLEDELGVQLFERLPRGIRLTGSGKLMRDRTARLLDELNRTVLAVQNSARGITGALRVGFADGATYSGHMPAVIREFRQAYPEVDLELIPATSLTQEEMLVENAIDAGFVYWIPQDVPSLDHQTLSIEKVVVAVSTNNRLSKHATVRLSQLEGLPAVWIKRHNAPMFYDMVLSECSRAGVTLNVVQEVLTESAMLSLAAADIGLTFITEAAFGRKPHNIKLLPIEDFKPTLEMRAVWRTDNYNPALQNFIHVVRRFALKK
jgi:DNA-binding transcriptional LysR family regulator